VGDNIYGDYAQPHPRILFRSGCFYHRDTSRPGNRYGAIVFAVIASEFAAAIAFGVVLGLVKTPVFARLRISRRSTRFAFKPELLSTSANG
jgi:hypothetical protein